MEKSDLGYRSLTDCVRDYLKKQLNNGEFKPGDEININALSETLGVSRTPIREALIQLVKDGFVELMSRKKFIIRKLTKKNIQDIYQVIGVLEAEAASFACQRITDEEIGKLEELYTGMKDSLKRGDMQTYLELNLQSHAVISRLCENSLLLDIVNKLKERLYDFPKIMVNIPEWEKKLMDEHFMMIEYLKSRDERALSELIKNEHWDFSKNYSFILKYYKIFSLGNSERSDQK
jgi:DNA-binding GntR family transcriptional regulator